MSQSYPLSLGKYLQANYPPQDRRNRLWRAVTRDGGQTCQLEQWDPSLGDPPTPEQVEAWAKEQASAPPPPDAAADTISAYLAATDLDSLKAALISSTLAQQAKAEGTTVEVVQARIESKGIAVSASLAATASLNLKR